MNENTAVVLSACITAVVTIIGFVVTYFLNKKNFKSEINREKININLDKIADLPYKIQELMNTMLDQGGNTKTINDFKELMSLIFAYGSKEAIMLITNMQQLNYRLADNNADADKAEVIPYYILLLCQIKYDLTGIKINPEYWFRMRLSDYSTMEKDLKRATNKIVEKLKLDTFLKFKK